MKRKIAWTWLTAALAFLAIACNNTEKVAVAEALQPAWWKEAIVYQVYPRSFRDTDGDGVGDLRGIIASLDYIKSLGVTAVWLNPVYESPNDDNGYDVSDYRAIMQQFGTMDDFDALLQGLHQRGIKLVMDIVVNHSSDEHNWFQQSRSSRNSPYRNYYHWWNAERGKPPYRYSLFDVNHDAWQYDSLTNAYYLHYFSKKQPDLNWENPVLRNEVYDIMRFWADKGVDGFRLDAFQFVAKDTTWPAWPVGYEKDFIQYIAMGPNIHEYLREMHDSVFSRYDVMSVAEGAGRNLQEAHDLVDAERKELNMAYAFEAIDIPKPNGYDLVHLKSVFSKWDSAFAEKGWLSIYLANHDNARMVSRYASDLPQYREYAAKMLNTFLLSMRGTPYCYYGDELGMVNPGFSSIGDYKDVQALNEYRYQQQRGANLDSLLQVFGKVSRDNGRTPMPWNNLPNAGFTTGKPWIALHGDYERLNVAAQESDPNSVLNHFKKMAGLRKQNKTLVYGAYSPVDADNSQVFAYTRSLDDKTILVLLNFSKETARVNTSLPYARGKVLIHNYSDAAAQGELRPFEAMMIELK